MASEIHVGDVGTIFRVTVRDGGEIVVLTGTTTRQFWFKRPDHVVDAKSAVFVTDGSDGQLQYTTVAGDLNQYGTWQLQVYLSYVTGSWHSDITGFEVVANVS